MESNKLLFKDRVVIITGSGGGLGKAYALEYARRGAKVVVNDLGGTLGGAGSNSRAADIVVAEIRKHGGIAVANYDSVNENGGKIVQTAIDNFGRVDILINNAGILRDMSFAKMTEIEFSKVVDVHLNGAYKLCKAAWPYMLDQKFGRIINTASPAGLYGNFGQANYSAAKLGLVGMAETLAKEGHKYNIKVNAIAPLARSRMTENVLPPHILKQLGPEKIVPLVLFLSHESTNVSNSIFELAGGFYGQIRWERSSGQIFNPDPKTFTPEAILSKWKSVNDFQDKSFNKVQHPMQLSDYNDLILKAKSLPQDNDQGTLKIKSLRGKVVIITGAGAGLGKSHAEWFAKYGAKIVVNDIKNPEQVVDELNQKYGTDTAVADTHDIILEAPHIIQTALKAFRRLDVVINNAGILRDRSFKKMTDQDWFDVLKVHLLATFAVCKAAWPVFVKQNSGYIINTTSTSGIYGNFGQANYAAAKAAILGFSKTIALEGAKRGIRVNVIAPHAETAMTKTIFTQKELTSHFDASQVSPFVVLLASEELQRASGKNGVNGQLFEVGGGWCGKTRWQRSRGFVSVSDHVGPELLRDNWSKITDFKHNAVNPSSAEESSMAILQAVQKAQMVSKSKDIFNYTSKDCILYNLGLGATSRELQYSYENDPKFQVLPSYAVIPFMSSITQLKMDELVDNFNYAMLLHGEQYFKLYEYPLPTQGSLRTVVTPLQVMDKGGKAAVIVGGFKTYDVKTKKLLSYNEGTFFVRGARTNESKKAATGQRAKFAVKSFRAPSDVPPDFEAEIKTDEDQAAIYRLSGDYNPLHIDPKIARSVNFPRPILHGLCTLGVSAKALLEKYGAYDELKVRFTNVVFPGDKLKIRAWKQNDGTVIFQTLDIDRNAVVLDFAAIKLVGSGSKL